MPGVDALIGRTIAHYEVLEKIGGGGMGVVYRARDQRLGRDVAIKLLKPGEGAHGEHLRRLFEREARFRGFIEQGIRDGSITPCDPHLTALFILGASRHMMQWYDPDAGHDLREIVERFVEFCCRGLEPRATVAAGD